MREGHEKIWLAVRGSSLSQCEQYGVEIGKEMRVTNAKTSDSNFFAARHRFGFDCCHFVAGGDLMPPFINWRMNEVRSDIVT